MDKTRVILHALESFNLPDSLSEALVSMTEGLKSSAQSNLEAVIIYGSIARGHYRPGQSDVNLLLLLKSISSDELDKVESVLRIARNKVNAVPMIMTAQEVVRAADVFPVKFMHIKNYHVLLFGTDPFEELKISPEHVRIRLEQELRNISIRLRNRYVSLHHDRTGSAALVSNMISSFAVQMRTLLELTGNSLPAEHSTSAHLKAAASVFNLDEDALLAASSLRRGEPQSMKEDEILARLMTCVDKAVEVADKLEVRE